MTGSKSEELQAIARQMRDLASSLIAEAVEDPSAAMDTFGLLTQEAFKLRAFAGVDYVVFRDLVCGTAVREGEHVNRGIGWLLAVSWLHDHQNELNLPDTAQFGARFEDNTPNFVKTCVISGYATAVAALMENWSDVEPPPKDPPAGDRFIFAEDGADLYYIEAFGTSGRFKRLRGFDHIYMLLQTPERPVSIRALIANPDAEAVQARRGSLALGGDGIREDSPTFQPVMDEQGQAAAWARCQELQGELERAKACGDTVEEGHCQEELDKIVEELSLAKGLGGKDKNLDGTANRHRSGLLGNLKRAYKTLRESEPSLAALADHLEASISTASGMAQYEPIGLPSSWTFSQSEK